MIFVGSHPLLHLSLIVKEADLEPQNEDNNINVSEFLVDFVSISCFHSPHALLFSELTSFPTNVFCNKALPFLSFN